MWAAGYGSTVRAVRCADLVLPLRPKDDPTDKFDDAVEFVRQFVTFLEVASSARAPWAQGESSRSLLLCLPRSATSKKSVSLMHKMIAGIAYRVVYECIGSRGYPYS